MKKRLAAYGIILLSVMWIAIQPKLQPITKHTQNPSVKHEGSLVTKLERHTKDTYIAEVLSQSKRPYLYAAIAKVETGYVPQAKGKDGEEGMFQIIPHIWGDVPDSLPEQLKKAESILEPMIKIYGLRDAVRRYNGAGLAAERYADKVLRERKKIMEG